MIVIEINNWTWWQRRRPPRHRVDPTSGKNQSNQYRLSESFICFREVGAVSEMTFSRSPRSGQDREVLLAKMGSKQGDSCHAMDFLKKRADGFAAKHRKSTWQLGIKGTHTIIGIKRMRLAGGAAVS